MPYVSKAQVKACYAKKNAGTEGSWDCEEWSKHTPSIKSLPEHSKKASSFECLIPGFIKLAKRIFDPNRYPQVKAVELEGRDTAPLVQNTIVKRIQKASQQQKSQVSASVEKTASTEKSVIIWD